MATEFPGPIERWTVKRRVSLVVSILKGENSVAEAARTHGLTVVEVDNWREKFLLGAENALRSRPRDDEAVKDEQIKKLKTEDRRSGARQRYLTGGLETVAHEPEDIRRVRVTLPVSRNDRAVRCSASVEPACIGRPCRRIEAG